MKVAVIGGGKIGLPLACALAAGGADVTVCDINAHIVSAIAAARSPHDEPGLAERIERLAANGRLRSTLETASAVADADAVVVIVPALLSPKRDIDYGNLESACRAVGHSLKRNALVSVETTVPVGGCRAALVPALEEGGLVAGRDFRFVFSPERVKSKLIFERLGETPKVVGGFDAQSTRAGADFYRTYLGAPVIEVESLEAAEFVKLAGMVYRDVNIALANELAAFAVHHGLEPWRLLDAADTDGETHLLRPGIGVGGHCTPVYPHFLIQSALRQGLSSDLVTTGRRINEAQPQRQAARLAAALGGLKSRWVHVLGLAFRPGVREDAYTVTAPLRESLAAAGARVTVEDELFTDKEIAARGFEPARAGAAGQSAIILATAHPSYATPDFKAWRKAGVRVVLDGRNFWRRDAVTASGLVYLGIG
jgi:nucleotide sugar dehydrogenase